MFKPKTDEKNGTSIEQIMEPLNRNASQQAGEEQYSVANSDAPWSDFSDKKEVPEYPHELMAENSAQKEKSLAPMIRSRTRVIPGIKFRDPPQDGMYHERVFSEPANYVLHQTDSAESVELHAGPTPPKMVDIIRRAGGSPLHVNLDDKTTPATPRGQSGYVNRTFYI